MAAPDHTMEHLANERTFLSWIRTGVAFIGVGALWTIYAAFEYRGTFRAIETGVFKP